ncbi:histone-fold-containing protein [Coprinopsis sp. MPI-PUGE-AT-0042]|nr:histone-fold-containing protein [Coprinopsis sp. MPI-PUGE-AT-0042]
MAEQAGATRSRPAERRPGPGEGGKGKSAVAWIHHVHRTQTRVSNTQKAGLVFSVPRTRRKLRGLHTSTRIEMKAAVFMASVMEYMLAELLETAGHRTKTRKRIRITNRDIMLGIDDDSEMKRLLKSIVIPYAGVVPWIDNKLLFPKKVKIYPTAQRLNRREPTQNATSESESESEAEQSSDSSSDSSGFNTHRL